MHVTGPLPPLPRPQQEQITAVIGALQQSLGPALQAVYLHGSATTGGLRPESDIDLLAVITRPMSTDERRTLLAALMTLSPLHPGAADDPRCLEVMVFVADDQARCDHPAEVDFLYGEWLRQAFASGVVPMPHRSPDNTLILAQAAGTAIALTGDDVGQRLPEIEVDDIRRAVKDALPSLMDNLPGDERNVLLTLARMWWTATSGTFASKDQAAAWAVARMPAPEGQVLDLARRAYLGQTGDAWGERRQDAVDTAGYLQRRVVESLGQRLAAPDTGG